MKTIYLLLGMFLFACVLSSCDKKKPIDPNEGAYEKAAVSSGGIMFDKFWSAESGFDQNDPNIATFDASKDFFRCKQCHGWDGLGQNGAYISRPPKTTRPNVAALNLYEMVQNESPQELFDGLKATVNRRDISFDLSTYDPETNNTEGDKMPNLTQILTDAQIWDIVKFLKEGIFDVSELYDAAYSGSYPTGSAAFSNVGLDGDAANGNSFYTANCVACHGTDGTSLDLEGKTLGKFIRSKPNESQHKVKYGQLGSSMVGEFDMTINEMRDLYKALSDTAAFPDEALIKGDLSLGGIMFDKFWSAESGFDQSDPNIALFDTYKDFFRCKQCHGWDGLGRNGAYIGRAPKTTRPNVSPVVLYERAQSLSPQELFDALTRTANRRDIAYDLASYDPETNNTEGDKMPNLNQVLTEAQIWNLVSFLKEGMFDVTELYDAAYTGSYPTGSVEFSNVGRDGDAANGNDFYTANCAACHGADGTNIDLEGKTVGKFTRSKPYEVHHKVKYGQLGSSMKGEFDMTLTDMTDLYKACADTTVFPD
ncbi:MAG: c-type cytochrome [Bacteroidales bacterium]|nr:c-type cytochrome [Bacteroidales bacterium]MCF6342070.1 c-type cytochrome [Bacteroidales bacterium]